MKNLTVETILKLSGGTLYGKKPEGEITAITTDSREAVDGCLFAAIRGERADGHDFAFSAFKRGAACALVEHLPEDAAGCMIQVPDTVTALQKIAGFYRDQFDLPVVGVTGSAGKTTAKEMIAAVLSRRFAVHKTSGNYNNDLGVPLTLFGLREDQDAAVVELGVSHPGDMARIASIARPTMAVYTNIGDAHLEFLGDREGVLREKSVLNRFLPEDGLVICNGDDPLLAGMTCAQRKITFGLGGHRDLRAERVQPLPDGTTRCQIAAGDRRVPVTIPAFGDHMVYAVLAAAAVGLELGLALEEIAGGVADYVQVGGRGRMFRSGQITVIDDCYNANPTSMALAIRSLSHQPGRKVCILGDMLELGARSDLFHADTGALARHYDIDIVLTAGNEAKHIAEGAGGIARHFEDRAALIAALPELILPGDTVLVKASRSMRFEEVTKALEELF